MKGSIVVIAFCFSVFVVFAQNTIDPSSIDIVRDQWGVPHVFARTDAEVAYGLAWAHSEDDFETLQKSFLASKSMLGLHSSREGATIDYVVHLLQLRELVDSLYEKDIAPDFKALLQGYCDGFNAYADLHPRQVLVKRAFPITPQDVITYSVLQLSIGCGVEAALKKIYNGNIPLAKWEPGGSNAFAFNSKKTADGNVFLAINTHHPLEGQVAWYEAHLSSEEGWNIIGSLFPGSPIALIGINENLGWAHTVNHPDKLDVYQLEMNPNNELQYKVDNTWYTLEEKTVKLKVKMPGFNAHVKKKIYKSIYGPAMVTPKGVFSIRTGGLMDIRGLEQWYRMNKARNFHQFKSALKMESHASYNVVYGDRYDTIYYLSNGKIPYRHPGFDWKGTLPGNTSLTLWTKFHPVEELPQLLNPPSGYVFNANHSPFKATAESDNIREFNYDSTMGYETHDNNRSLRFVELMQPLKKVGYDDFKRIKYDFQLPQKLAFPVNIDTVFLLDGTMHPALADLIHLLKSWDRKGTTDSHGATAFAILFYYVAERYQREETFRSMSEKDCVEALYYVQNQLKSNFGTIRVSLGEYQRLERGNKSFPLPGLPDVLASMYSTPIENGRVKGAVGDCYISLVKFTPSGPEIETVNNFGASNRPGNAHYDDQMPLYLKQQTKKMTLSRQQVYREARTIYHPEVLSRLPVTARLTRNRR
jgi:acyl-homoserine-lactone acylase